MMKAWDKGFTLVEVMIAMAIMGTLVAMVSQSVATGVQTKKKMNGIVQAQANMFDSIRIVKRDVEKAFHYQDVFYQIEKKSIDAINKELGKGNSAGGGAKKIPVPKKPEQITVFMGEKDEMHFTSLNNIRTRFNVQQSDQMEVGYFVESCTPRKSKKKTAQCLYRRTHPYIDNEVEKGGRKMVVAEYVTKFELQYRSNEEDAEWFNDWKSTGNGRPQHKDKFPHLVKMVLEIYNEDDKQGKKLREEVILPIHFPNNEIFFQPEAPRAKRP